MRVVVSTYSGIVQSPGNVSNLKLIYLKNNKKELESHLAVQSFNSLVRTHSFINSAKGNCSR